MIRCGRGVMDHMVGIKLWRVKHPMQAFGLDLWNGSAVRRVVRVAYEDSRGTGAGWTLEQSTLSTYGV